MVRRNVIRRDREILGGHRSLPEHAFPFRPCWTIWRVVSRYQSS
jgi:hypothetical protein